MLDLTYRPIRVWPSGWRERTWSDRETAPFRSTLTQTLSLLEHECRQIGATRYGREVVAQVDARSGDFRRDGQLRADARIDHPGLILTVDHERHGALTYATDRFDTWRDNLRAIALGMEALRKVERYGIADQGQQYAGYRELGSGIAMGPASMTVDQACRLLAEEGSHQGDPLDLLDAPMLLGAIFRRAAAKHHPDNGGDAGRFDVLVKARDLIEGAA